MAKTLSEKDRLLFANQYEILAKLSKDEDEKKYYENMRDAFFKGFTWAYGLAAEGLHDELTDEECRFVIDVLDMYSSLYYSRENSKEAKEMIAEEEVLFKGFDLNDSQESRYLSFYIYLVKDLDRFTEFKEWIDEGKIEDFNSHGFGPSIDKLRRMVNKTKELKMIRRKRNDMYFTKEEIRIILDA